MGKDRLTKERRSWNMSRIRGKDTTPEMLVRSALHRLGYRFRLHVRIPIPDSPQRRRGAEVAEPKRRTPRAVSVDILLPKHKTAIFVHGCFSDRFLSRIAFGENQETQSRAALIDSAIE